MTPRWTKLRYHPKQWALYHSPKRFIIAPGGRRSGKTEVGGKRKGVRRAIAFNSHHDGRFLFTAPTHQQAKDVYWRDLKALVPKDIVRRVSESELFIELCTGTRLQCAGMDVPERAEGSPLDGIVLDEFANMKADVWPEHVSPALDTPGRPGWAIFPSVPEGRNHYFALYNAALNDIAERGEASEWAVFHWFSSEIMEPEAIERARRRTDPLTFQQEYEGSFVNFAGLAYYRFNRSIHAAEPVEYDPTLPLVFCFDFNTSPGVAVVCQIGGYHQDDATHRPEVDPWRVIRVIGEVHIPSGSKTSIVCNRLINDWAHIHTGSGEVFIYGDFTGGAVKTSSEMGSDWDIIRQTLGGVKHWKVHNCVEPNPRERTRVNVMNSALRSTDGVVRILFDSTHCPNVIDDFECVVVVEGGSGELSDKDKKHTHMTDALGYFVYSQFRHLLEGQSTVIQPL